MPRGGYYYRGRGNMSQNRMDQGGVSGRPPPHHTPHHPPPVSDHVYYEEESHDGGHSNGHPAGGWQRDWGREGGNAEDPRFFYNHNYASRGGHGRRGGRGGGVLQGRGGRGGVGSMYAEERYGGRGRGYHNYHANYDRYNGKGGHFTRPPPSYQDSHDADDRNAKIGRGAGPVKKRTAGDADMVAVDAAAGGGPGGPGGGRGRYQNIHHTVDATHGNRNSFCKYFAFEGSCRFGKGCHFKHLLRRVATVPDAHDGGILSCAMTTAEGGACELYTGACDKTLKRWHVQPDESRGNGCVSVVLQNTTPCDFEVTSCVSFAEWLFCGLQNGKIRVFYRSSGTFDDLE